jgi:hypothetical protein
MIYCRFSVFLRKKALRSHTIGSTTIMHNTIITIHATFLIVCLVGNTFASSEWSGILKAVTIIALNRLYVKVAS